MEIRKVKKEEYQMLVDFLREYWKRDHTLIKSKQLMDFQHLDGDTYNFYAAIEEGEIYAVNGFIKTSSYDESLIEEDDIWGAIWKSRADVHKGELGLWLKEAMSENEKRSSMGGIGLSDMAYKINKKTGSNMGYLHQYYVANRMITDFAIGKELKVDKKIHPKAIGWRIEQNIRLLNIQEPCNTYRPRKTKTYFENRYLYHPVYKYIFWGIYHNEDLVSVWSVRRITVNGNSVFRVIDVLGRIDVLPDLTENLQQILKEESCEYIDFLNYGIKSEVFEKIGFTELDLDQDSIVVPTYFEPFERRNVKIRLSYRAKYDEYVVFKGDADQDRPNIL